MSAQLFNELAELDSRIRLHMASGNTIDAEISRIQYRRRRIMRELAPLLEDRDVVAERRAASRAAHPSTRRSES